jgi:hypothetical protein
LAGSGGDWGVVVHLRIFKQASGTTARNACPTPVLLL